MLDRIRNYIRSDRHLPVVTGFLPGAYALSYLYLKNFTLVDSWPQFLFFIAVFILAPVLVASGLHFTTKKTKADRQAQLHFIMLGVFLGLYFSLAYFQEVRWSYFLIGVVLVLIGSFFLARLYKIGILLLGLMLIFSLGQLMLKWYGLQDDTDWVNMDKEIVQTNFQQTPNIYVIQPDGYPGQPALQSEFYQFDNIDFRTFLDSIDFKIHDNFRSNYSSTLTSNASMFTAQHHFYAAGEMGSELYKARDIITGPNPVLKTFKDKGYQTHLVMQHKYLLMNHPAVYWDHVNIDKVGFFPDYHENADVAAYLKSHLHESKQSPQFFFVELFEPSHITHVEAWFEGYEKEREKYLKRLEKANLKLKELLDLIARRDPSAIVILAADHSGFLGLSHSLEAYKKVVEETNQKQTIFSALFAIKAPEDSIDYFKEVNSSITVFPALFQYLTREEPSVKAYDQSSYQLVRENGKAKVYRYFDSEGRAVTEELSFKNSASAGDNKSSARE